MWSVTLKRSSEILADENGNFFREKGKFVKFSRKSKFFSKIGGRNLKQGGERHHGLKGGWTPLPSDLKKELLNSLPPYIGCFHVVFYSIIYFIICLRLDSPRIFTEPLRGHIDEIFYVMRKTY